MEGPFCSTFLSEPLFHQIIAKKQAMENKNKKPTYIIYVLYFCRLYLVAKIYISHCVMKISVPEFKLSYFATF
jgi:hypothetical protein